MKLLLEIITPQKVVYKNEVEEVIAPTVNGEIAILPNHIGLLTQITPGELIVKKGNKDQSIAITGGFLEVNNNHISILADFAVKSEDINVARAEEAKKRAEALMKEKTTEKDFRIAEAQMLKALLELKIASKHKMRRLSP